MKCIMGDVQGAYSTIKTILLCFKMIKIVMMPYWNATFSSQRCSNLSLLIEGTIFPQIIAGTIISFLHQKGMIIQSREAIIWNIAHWKLYPKYFVLLSH